MGQSVSRDDFIWTLTEQPHMSRREEIVKKYPEVKKVSLYFKTYEHFLKLKILAIRR